MLLFQGECIGGCLDKHLPGIDLLDYTGNNGVTLKLYVELALCQLNNFRHM